MPKTVIVIPCYNEERRLRSDELLAIVQGPSTQLLLVDDGSTDRTFDVMQSIADQESGRVRCLQLPANRGKAEAVRSGMLAALEDGVDVVGFVDADASTPAGEVLRLVKAMERDSVMVVMGARVAMLGSEIRRSYARHLLGRVFATAASAALSLPVYDTQCGAKLFRTCPALRDALAQPFRSPWSFDVELIGRLLAPSPGVPPLSPSDFLEVPVRRWEDIGGSKLRLSAMLRAGLALLPIAAELRARRKRFRDGGRC